MSIFVARVSAILLGISVLSGYPSENRFSQSYADAASEKTDVAEYPRSYPIYGCENVFAVNERILSGGVPRGDTAFKALAAAGVNTIISVDGMKPDVEAAAKFGVRYAHLPIGYDGVPHQRTLEISRAVRDLPAKVYIHCHHGMHRSPAATAAVLVCSQGWSPVNAASFMKKAGTAESYTGLYSDVLNGKPATMKEIDGADNTFPSRVKTSDFVDTMIEIENRFDQLTSIRAAGWKTPVDKPDLVPANEALLLLELYKEEIRSGSAMNSEKAFVDWMVSSKRAAAALERALRKSDMDASERHYNELKNACSGCHEKYRNVSKKTYFGVVK
jgi:protein tyrosine phosphatase (PTP) superfamily phosphohydrolase (DUF442 family)